MSLVNVSNSLIIALFSDLEQHFRFIGGQLLVENKSSLNEKLGGEFLSLFVLLRFFSSSSPLI
jgi:hypothetical protein